MTKYLHFFKDKAEHDDAYKTDSSSFTKPWVSSIPRTIRGTRYFVRYNKYIETSTSSVTLSSISGTTTIDIDGISEWSASCDSSWFSVSPTAHTSGMSTLNITVMKNEGETRTGNITLTTSKGLIKTIEIKQMEKTSDIPSIIWVDDFPDGTDDENCGGPYETPYDPDFVECFYGHPTFDDYIDDYVEDPETFGSNRYVYAGRTFEYRGGTYFLYVHSPKSSQDNICYGLLPAGLSFDTLYANSIENNHSSNVDAFEYILNSDEEEYFETGDGDWYKLVKVEKPIDPHDTAPSVIYLDNFEDPQDIASDYPTFQDYMNAYLQDPYDMGSNYYSFTNETMEFNGETYYVYEGDLNIAGMETVQYGLMPTGYTYNMLYSNSMEADYDNRFLPFTYILTSDNDVYFDKETASGNNYVLAKVIQ